MKVSVMQSVLWAQTGAGKQGAPHGCVLGFSTWTLLCSVMPRFVWGVEFFFWNNLVVSGAHLWLSWNAKGNRSEYLRDLREDNLLPEQHSATSTPSPAFHLLERADKRRTSCLPLYINSKNTMRGKHPPEPKADTPKQGLAHMYSTHTHAQIQSETNNEQLCWLMWWQHKQDLRKITLLCAPNRWRQPFSFKDFMNLTPGFDSVRPLLCHHSACYTHILRHTALSRGPLQQAAQALQPNLLIPSM